MPESPLNRTCEIFQNCLTKKKKKKKRKKFSIPPPIPAGEMAASRPMREDAGKGRQRSFKFERNSLNMMVCCVKNKLLKQTRCQRQKQNKRKNKQNKGENTTKQTWSRFGCKGRKRTFFLGKNVNRIEDAFLENFSANRRPSACLSSYKSEMPLILTIPADFQLSSYTCLSDKS